MKQVHIPLITSYSPRAGARAKRRKDMYIGGSSGPLSALEELELRRERLAELIRLDLVSPSLGEQVRKAIATIDQQIAEARERQAPVRLAA